MISFYFPTEIPKIHIIKRNYERSKAKKVSLQELQKYAEKVNMLLMLEDSDKNLNTAMLNIMDSISPDWGVEDQDEQSKPLKFSVKSIGTFCFGEICGLKVGLWDKDDNDLKSDEIKEVLQCFSATKCIVYMGFALAFNNKTCKRGDVIVSDCIDGVETINTDDKIEDAVKCSFYPDDTRLIQVPKTLRDVFNKDWRGILCTEQRQRKSKVVKGTMMTTQWYVFNDENMLDQLQKWNTYRGLSIEGVPLLKAVKECEKEVIFIHGVAFFASEKIHGNSIGRNWYPTVAESLADYIKFRLKKTVHSHSYFSGRH